MQHGKVRATISKSQDPESLTLEEALELLAEKAAKEVPAKKKITAKKTAPKKAAAKKSTVKKTTAKKPTKSAGKKAI